MSSAMPFHASRAYALYTYTPVAGGPLEPGFAVEVRNAHLVYRVQRPERMRNRILRSEEDQRLLNEHADQIGTFENCVFDGIHFTPELLHYAQFSNCYFRGCQFKGGRVPTAHTRFDQCDFMTALFDFGEVRQDDEPYFDRIIFTNCSLDNIKFKGDPSGSSLVSCVIWRSDFSGIRTDAVSARRLLTRTPAMYCNLSGLYNSQPTVQELMDQYYDRTADGLSWKAYKLMRWAFAPPEYWVLEPGSILHETVNPDPTEHASYGINCGTLDHISSLLYGGNVRTQSVWEVEIPIHANIVIPFTLSGVADTCRTDQCQLVRQLSEEEVYDLLQ